MAVFPFSQRYRSTFGASSYANEGPSRDKGRAQTSVKVCREKVKPSRFRYRAELTLEVLILCLSVFDALFVIEISDLWQRRFTRGFVYHEDAYWKTKILILIQYYFLEIYKIFSV